MERVNVKSLEKRVKRLEREARVWSYIHLLFDYAKAAIESDELAREHGYNECFIAAREEVLSLLNIFTGVSKERSNALYEQLAVLRSLLERAKTK